ncbi:hypothetical protein GCM10020001_070380 [Nonomuraea salmonea]
MMGGAHEGARVGGGVGALGDGQVAEVLGGGAVADHVGAGVHGVLLGRGDVAVWGLVLHLGADRQGASCAAHAELGAGVDGAVADDGLGHPRGHGERGLTDDGVRDAAAAELVEVPGDAGQAERGRDERGRGGVADAVGGQAVHGVGRQPGVLQGGEHGTAGQGERADSRVLGEGGPADARDGGAVAKFKQALGHNGTVGSRSRRCQRRSEGTT